MLDAQGNLYGTTTSGRDLACNAPKGCGTVFKLAPPAQPGDTWTESVLYSFTGGDGAIPFSDLVLDTQGNLYGTTYMGGDLTCNAPDGCGTAFKLTPPAQSGGGWTETVLYSFTGTGGDGEGPVEGLVLDARGNLYGTTYFGGDLSCPGGSFHGGNFSGCGIVFKLDTTGKETVLHTFTGTGLDGAVPYAGLVLDAQGNLYGTTAGGGDLACNAPSGCGTAFTLTIMVTPQSIINDVTQLFASGAISSSDVETGLLDKLNAALADRNSGMCGPAGHVYAAFINQVRAQAGKAITPAAAATVIADAQYLEAHCP